MTRKELTRRQFLTYGAVSGAGLVLAACGNANSGASGSASGSASSSASGSASGSAAAGASPSSSVLNPNASIKLVSWGFGIENTLAKSRVEAFNQANPNIGLEVVPKVDDQKILTAVASGDVPDLLWLGREAIASWAARGALEPIDDLIARDSFDMNGFYPATVQQVTYNDQRWAVPQFADVRPLWVNLDPLQQGGLSQGDIENASWEQLREYGVKLTQNNNGQFTRWGFDTKGQDFFWMYAWGNGAEMLSADGKTVSLDDPKAIEALEYIVETTKEQGGRQALQAFSETWGSDAQHPFVMNQVAITPYESWLLGIVARFAPQHNFAVLPFKGRDGKPVSITGGLSWAIPKGAKNKDAAWEFIKFMSAAETWKIGAQAVKQENAAKNAPFIPSLTANESIDNMLRTEVYEPIDEKFDKVISSFPELIKSSRSLPASPVVKELGDILTQQAINPALLGEKSAADALKDAQARAEQAIKNFRGQ